MFITSSFILQVDSPSQKMISVQENTKNKELRTSNPSPDEANIENLQNIDGITFTSSNNNVVHHRRHRNSRANFKNPPQPSFCIKEQSSENNQLLFINVLSWSRIANPVNPLEPVPLYGGMRVILGRFSCKNEFSLSSFSRYTHLVH